MKNVKGKSLDFSFQNGKDEEKGRSLMAIRAKESNFILKARQKLQEKMTEEKKQLSPEALKKSRDIINKRLHNSSSLREPLKNASVTSFDANQHSEEIHSEYIKKLLKNLRGQ